MKKIAALLFALIFLAGCQPTAKLLFGINRQYDFSSREEMAAHFHKKNRIEKDRPGQTASTEKATVKNKNASSDIDTANINEMKFNNLYLCKKLTK